MDFFLLIKIFIISSLLAYLLTALVIFIYTRLGWMDDPKKAKLPNVIHKKPVPRGGGIPIFLTIFIVSSLFLPLDKHLLGIILGGLLIMVIGFFDDLFNLNPYLRLIIGFLASGCVISAGIGIAFISSPLGGIIRLDQPQIPFFLLGKWHTIWVLADLFALLWITWTMNFVNWSKGIDGQLPGIIVVAGLTIAMFSLRYSADITQWPVIILALIVSGAYLGFLPWNFYPQKIMPGYGGGALAGYFLAVLTILSTTKVGTGMIVLAVPMIDALSVIFQRLKKGRSPVWPDTGHFHHRLMALGWSKRKIAVFYWLISGFFGLIALTLNHQLKFYTISILAIIFISILLWLNYLRISSLPPGRSNG